MKTKNKIINSKEANGNKKKKVISIIINVLLAYVVTELVFVLYKYGNYSPAYLIAPVIFLLTLIYLNTTHK